MGLLSKFKRPVTPASAPQSHPVVKDRQVVRIKGLAPKRSINDENNPGVLVYGLDPSLTAFGVVRMFECGEVLSKVTIETKLKGMERLDYLIKEVVVDRIAQDWLIYGKQMVVVREDYAYSEHSGSDAVLKELGGILEWELHKRGIPLHCLNISTVKKFASGKGNCTKEELMKAVFKRWGFDGDEDQSDAFAVAITAIALMNAKRIEGLDTPQKECILAQADHALYALH